MDPATDRSLEVAWALIAAALVAAPSAIAFAQSVEPEPEAAVSEATPADQPRSRRERRRAEQAQSTAQAPPAELPVTEVRAVAPTEPVVEDEEPEIVCKTIKVLGTKIGQRVCGTPEQWAASTRRNSEAARDAMREISTRSGFPATPEVPTAVP